jgi:caa(3)-type oxidase subunit IV
MTMANSKKSGNTIAKYLPVYFSLLAIAVLEVILAYQHFSTGALLAILLALAACGGTLALRYFMHLAQETRGLFLTLIPAVVFVLLMMNMIWSDSFRLLRMRPFGH